MAVRLLGPAEIRALANQLGAPGLTRERGDRHDPPAAPRHHHLERRLRDQEDPAQVDVLDPVPFVGLDPVERRRVERACAGDEDVERAAARDRLLDDPPRILGLRDVGRDRIAAELSTASCAAVSFRSARTTVAPSAASAREQARPMPLAAPVTTAVLPASPVSIYRSGIFRDACGPDALI